MTLYAFYIFLALISFVWSEGDDVILKPCSMYDRKCLNEETSHFFERTSDGIPKFDVKPLDPLNIPSLDVVVDKDIDVVLSLKNINVNGLKNQKFADFEIDVKEKNVQLKTIADNFHIAGNIDVTKNNKTLSGEFTAMASALGETTYNYSFSRINDQDHFILGPEINTCQILGVPEVTLSNDFIHAFDNDPDFKSIKEIYAVKKHVFHKIITCKIVETAYGTVVHNIRASAKVFPKNHFFTDV